jgi:Terminase RNAseH like domain
MPRYFFDQVPGSRDHDVWADCAQPESVSYLAQHGCPRVRSVAKWTGSILDGLSFLRTFQKIVVDANCTELLEQLRLYSFKRDRLSGAILADPVDAFNDGPDALRYALSSLIRAGDLAQMGYLKLQMDKAKAAAAGASAAPTGGVMFGSELSEEQRRQLRERDAEAERAMIRRLRRSGGYPIN